MVLFASLAVCSELISNGGIGIHRFRIEDFKFCGLQYFGLDLLKLVVVRPIRFNLDFFKKEPPIQIKR